jgi:hypothetical protein
MILNNLALVPCALGILKDLSIGCTPILRLLFCGLTALILHLATVEAHASMLDCRQQSGFCIVPLDRMVRRQAPDYR